jgi:hypothetical protein
MEKIIVPKLVMDFFVEQHIQLSPKNMKDWTQEYYCLKCAKMQRRPIYMKPII